MENKSGQNPISKYLLWNAEKKQREPVFRSLWRECFGDPVAYEEFYFDKVYPHNCVYGMQEKGMIHLNPYPCHVLGRHYNLHYIVGVATKEAYRRQGIMRQLLQKAFADLRAAKEPFTYLMPADERYYIPFDFFKVSRKRECSIENLPMLHAPHITGRMQFISYREIKQKKEDVKQNIFRSIEQWLAERYAVYAIHDEAYFDLLFEEKNCQKGDVVLCFEEGKNANSFLGFFAYVMDGTRPCVEQIVCRYTCGAGHSDTGNWEYTEQTWCRTLIEIYFNERRIADKPIRKETDIRVMLSYPYMVRPVHMESFLNLFAESLKDHLNGADGIWITDPIIHENSGFYHFEKTKGEWTVFYYDKVPEGKESVPMTVLQLSKIIFGEKKNVFFSEII